MAKYIIKMKINWINALIIVISTCCLTRVASSSDKEDHDTITLNLSGEGRKSLDSINFSLYPDVVEIDLSDNELTLLKEDTFLHNKKLKKLNFANNKELYLPEFSTFLIADIEELNLTGCNIYELPSNALDGLQHLKVVDLRNNPLKILDAFTFSVLYDPEILYIPSTATQYISEICITAVTLKIITDSKENNVYQCVNGTLFHNEPSYKKEDEIISINNDEAKEDEEFDSSQGSEKNIDVVLEEIYPMIEMQNDQPLPVDDDEASGDDPIKDIKISLNSAIDGQLPEQEVSKSEGEQNIEKPTEEKPESDPAGSETQPPIQETPEKAVSEVVVKQEDANGQNTESLPSKELEVTEPTKVKDSEKEVNKVETELESEKETSTSKSTDNNTENKKVAIQTFSHNFVNVEDNKESEASSNGVKGEIKTAGSSSEQSNSNKNIFVILGVAVLCIALAAFGYRWYKSRQYHPAQTEEPVERELKEISVRTNGVPIQEQEPLMKNSTPANNNIS